MGWVVYCRVSTTEQATGTSLAAQADRCRRYLDLHGHGAPVLTVTDTASGSTLERTGLDIARGWLRTRQAEGLVVTALDRLTRSVADLGELLREQADGGWALAAVDDRVDTATAAGRLALHLVASVGQWERERLHERCAEGRLRRRSEGGYLGGAPPVGWSVDGDRLVPVDAEQDAIRVARELRGQGVSLRGVATALAERGHLSRVGTRYSAEAVRRMVCRG